MPEGGREGGREDTLVRFVSLYIYKYQNDNYALLPGIVFGQSQNYPFLAKNHGL